ncbi:MAG: branched-chain-amino-acid transaminase [Phycisphaeraceae bacterium]
MTLKVLYNGQMLAPDQAHIPHDDAGFQHAVGLFETMLAENGRVFRLDDHLNRLCESARILGLSHSLDPEALAEAVNKTISENGLQRARIRLTVTPGSLSMVPGRVGRSQPTGTVLIQPSEPTEYDPRYFEEGITALVAPPGANPFDSLAGHKTLSYWGRLRTLRQAASVGAGEAIWLNITNHLASGAVSNIFLVKDGKLLTPIARGEELDKSLPAPVLPGITRAAVIELAEARDIPVEKRMLAIDDLLGADEVFLTNSSWHILPVTRVEKSSVGDGKVGEITSSLRQALLELIERETSLADAN